MQLSIYHCKFFRKIITNQKEGFTFALASESSSVGRAQASQAWGRGFEPRFSLKTFFIPRTHS